MSKLNGVKTVDMANGEITKVTYDGAEYVKVPNGKAQIGDIFFETSGNDRVSEGVYYQVVGLDNVNDPEFIDDSGETNAINQNVPPYNLYYRKVNAKPSQLQVGDTVKVSIPDGQRPAYGWGLVENSDVGKVISVNGGDVSVEFPTHSIWNGRLTELVKVAEDGYVRVTDRDPKAGDYVKFTELSSYGEEYISLGEYYEIIEVDEYGDPYVIDDEGDSYDTDGEDYEVYEKAVAESEALTFKGAEYTLVQRKAQPGDVVVFTENTSLCFTNGKTYGPVSEELKVADDDGPHLCVYHTGFNRTVDNVKVYAPVAVAETLKEENTALRVGDYAKVAAHVTHDGYAGAGDIVTLHSNEGGYYNFKVIKLEDTGNYTLFNRDQLVKATDAEVAKAIAPKFSVGDYVKLVKSTRGNEGKIAKIVGINVQSYDYEIELIPKAERHYGSYESWIVKATDAEVAEAKLAEQFAKLGRKPNEFKNGDVVRVINRSWGGHPVGTVGELVYDEGLGKLRVKAGNGVYSHIPDIELIAPVESRVDRQ